MIRPAFILSSALLLAAIPPARDVAPSWGHHQTCDLVFDFGCLRHQVCTRVRAGRNDTLASVALRETGSVRHLPLIEALNPEYGRKEWDGYVILPPLRSDPADSRASPSDELAGCVLFTGEAAGRQIGFHPVVDPKTSLRARKPGSVHVVAVPVARIPDIMSWKHHELPEWAVASASFDARIWTYLADPAYRIQTTRLFTGHVSQAKLDFDKLSETRFDSNGLPLTLEVVKEAQAESESGILLFWLCIVSSGGLIGVILVVALRKPGGPA